MEVGTCDRHSAALTVAGQDALVDMFEMACSLGPYDCTVLDVVRTAADLSAATTNAIEGRGVVDGTEIVVWRDNKGAAHVWEDRCPHRGMRMSFGFVRGDHIACLYHGWEYDTAGQCRYIPAHPELEVPATIKVQTYAMEERDGIIWTRLSEGGDAADIPRLGPATP
eukprot:gene1961-biopygen1701